MNRLCLLISCLSAFAVLLPAGAMPNDAESIRQLRARAVECQWRGDRDGAIGLNRQAINLASRAFGAGSSYVAEMHYDIGVLALSDSNFNQAEESFEQAVHLNPNYYPARIKLAELMHLRGHPEVAVKESQLVLSKHRGNVQAREMLAIAYQDMGNSYKALRECFYLDQAIHGKMPPAPVIAPPPPAKPVEKPPAEETKKTEPPKPVKKETKPVEKKTAEKKKQTTVAKPKPKPVKKAPKVEETVVESDSASEENASEVTDEVKPVKAKKQSKVVSPTSLIPKPRRAPAGLVPPPPPVVPVYSPIAPLSAVPVKAKSVKTKAIEKVKEKPPEPVKEEKPAGEEKDDDFLLDWGGAKPKKK
ncbi:MAG: hypothetical protein K2W82_13630 [Candidatus Obscuribacterales bacterium]|nr:hypothetical protein [Candidatus Obscuribacterales bacterium]